MLTLFEATPADLLPWFCQLLDNLATAGLPVPAPLAVNGERTLTVADKPALLVPWLPGEHPVMPDAQQCRAIGQALGTLHNTPFNTPHPQQQDATGLPALAPGITALPRLHQRATDLWQRWQQLSLPQTLIHGDLFRDNLLWQDGNISALLDFYNACLDDPEYDLAVTLNDWCVDADGQPAFEREEALLGAYQANGGRYDEGRLQQALAVAALRFWLSRLGGPVASHSEGQGSKDPEEFARIYRWRMKGLEPGA